MNARILARTAASIILACTTLAGAQPGPVATPITYQGRLETGSGLANGTYQMYVVVYDQHQQGTSVGSAGSAANPLVVEVVDGLFTVELDLNPTQMYNGTERWLEIRVRRAGETTYTLLSPRQRLAPAPYANYALNIPSQWKAFSFIQGVGPVYNGTGRVGIGTDAPTHRLHTRATSNLTGLFESTSTVGTWLNIGNTSTGGRYWRLLSTGQANGEGSGNLLIGHGETPANHINVMAILNNGNVGINTVAPQRTLDVNGWARVHVFEVTGGSDIAEPFEVNAEIPVIPGMVVCIDPDRPGQMKLTGRAYDRTVAGVVSGAGGVNTGMTLRQEGSIADGTHPIALTGRVYCYVDADAGGAVSPGDMLTTSATPGHAMKVSDHGRATGAVIGKAMTSLDSGRGLVLVLVNLH